MKEDKISKYLSILIAVIAVIGGVFFIRVFMAGEAVETDVAIQNSVVSPLVTFSQYLLYAAIGVTLIASLLGMVKNPENLKKTVLGLVVLGVLLAISYFTADSNAVLDAQGAVIKEGGQAGSSINKWTGTGIWFSVILGGIGTLFFVWDLLKGLVKS